VAIAFMGGGACWSEATCYGTEMKTYLSFLPFVPISGGFVSQDPEISPVAGWTIVFFPYCTGDMFAANHIARYGKRVVHHVGRSNVERAFEMLKVKGMLDFEGATDLVVWGPSAGALSSLFHSQFIDGLFPRAVNRALIADAPGLHFGPTVWDKFPPKMLEEFSAGLRKAGMTIEKGKGIIAGIVPGICKLLPHWSVGVMQSSRDIIMSKLFGEITRDAHAKAVHSKEGILALTEDPSDLCRAWVPSSSIHTFLPTNAFLGVKAGGVSAREFFKKVVDREGGPNLADDQRATD
jgi:hypothetical protein